MSDRWWDHVTAWNYNGKPALLVSQPYQLYSGKAFKELAMLANDPDLGVSVYGNSWYGNGTIYIEIYRKDYLNDYFEVLRRERRRDGKKDGDNR